MVLTGPKLKLREINEAIGLSDGSVVAAFAEIQVQTQSDNNFRRFITVDETWQVVAKKAKMGLYVNKDRATLSWAARGFIQTDYL